MLEQNLNYIAFIDKLKDNINYRVLLLSAPLGYGKATFTKNFLSKYNKRYLWVDAKEGTDKVVWDKLLDQMPKFSVPIYKKLKKLGFPDTDEKRKILIDIFAEIKKEIIIVYNKLYCKNESIICQIISDIASNKAIKMKSIITTEHIEGNIFYDMSTEKICKIFDYSDLTLSEDEIKQYLSEKGITLSDLEILKIETLTAGWLFMIRLLAEEYNAIGLINDFPRTQQYIKRTLYDRQEKELKNEILKLVPFEKFSVEQALYIINSNDVITDKIKKIICSGNLFFCNRDTGLYSMYPLLNKSIYGEYLFKISNKNELLQRNGMWFEMKGEYINSIKSYFMAEDISGILRIIPKITLDYSSICKENLEVLYNVFCLLGNKKYDYLYLYFRFIYFYANIVNYSVALDLLSKDEEYFKSLDNNAVPLALISYVKSLFEFNNIGNMIDNLKISCNILNGDKVDAIVDSFDIFGDFSILTAFYRTSGTLKPTVEHLQEFMWLHSDITRTSNIAVEMLLNAEHALWTWDYDSALLLTTKAITAAKLHSQYGVQLSAYFILIRIYLFTDRAQNCKKIIENIVSLSKTEKVNPTSVDLILGYYYAVVCDYENVPYSIKSNDFPVLKLPANLQCIAYIVIGMVMLAGNRFNELEVLARSLMEERSKKISYQIFSVYANIFYTINRDSYEDQEAAIGSLWKAVKICELDEISFPFIEFSRYLIKYIESIATQNIFLSKILGNCKASNNIINSLFQPEVVYDFTEREQQIVDLLLKGTKQSDIADKLYISLSTVKKHIQKIYRKIGVSSRDEAIIALSSDKYSKML